MLRDGEERLVAAGELVPGDVILLSEGDHISADARLVREEELRVDQSTLTGESHPARKTSDAVPKDGLSRAELPNLVFAGTSVASGGGAAVVFATGMETGFGKIAPLTQSVAIRLAGRRLAVTGVGYAPAGEILEEGGASNAAADGDLRALLVAAGLCNNARLVPPGDRSGRWTVLGDPTEAGAGAAALECHRIYETEHFYD